MKFHWKVLAWMLAGALAGFALQASLGEGAWIGARWEAGAGGAAVAELVPGGPAATAELSEGDVVRAAIRARGTDREERHELATPADVETVLDRAGYGETFVLQMAGGAERRVTAALDPDSTLARILVPIDFGADVFMALLRMLIVPIVLTSIITGVAGVGTMRDLRRLGGKTLTYYVFTSLLAICVGQVLVTVFRPGHGAQLGLEGLEGGVVAADTSFVAFLRRMVPDNAFGALTDNGAMLSIIFFALVFGLCLARTEEPYRTRVTEAIEGLFQVILKMAKGVMALLPYGVFCLLARVVAKTGFAVFEPLLFYMLLVAAAILLHAVVTLPLLLRFLGRLSPVGWAKAMAPALMTAFSTSSSSMTLPVTMETVEQRGRVSNRVTSFTLPLGSTVNMDGTALYECIGVIFLAQYYATTGDFELTLWVQLKVVVLALLASIGAAGIPSAGLVMMMTILITLGLPTEGAALLLAVDRPLDMLRTVVNVWSDSCGAAIIARSEGEEGPLRAGAGP